MGLEKWFNQQLHPQAIDQTDLDARLAQFPAMQLNPEELLYRLPSNAVIRQVADGKASIPQDRQLRPIYEDELSRVELRRQEREQKKQAAVPANSAMEMQAANNPAMNESAGKMAAEPAQPSANQMNMSSAASKPDQPTFDSALIPDILALPPEQRIDRLAAMTAAGVRQLP